jgi:hypothetical protein
MGKQFKNFKGKLSDQLHQENRSRVVIAYSMHTATMLLATTIGNPDNKNELSHLF